jgi:tRNA modification GTPase
MYSLDDTIVAISTPVGEGGIGIVRLTGPEAAHILQQIFLHGSFRDHDASPHDSGAPRCPNPASEAYGQRRPACQTPMSSLQPRTLRYGRIVETSTGDTVDEVLAVFMPAPYTFTRQDVVEINGHGGPVALQRIQALCLRHGARLAQPGEFTARAFT